MKITMDFNEFKKGLEKVNKVSTKKSPSLIIENIYIEESPHTLVTSVMS